MKTDNNLKRNSFNRLCKAGTHDEWLHNRKKIERSFFKTNRKKSRLKKHNIFKFIISFAHLILKFYRGKEYWSQNAKLIKKEELQLSFEALPAEFDGYQILHISDLHLDLLPGLERTISSLAKGQIYDLVILTGDYIDDTKRNFADVVPALRHLCESIETRDGIVAVLGNHDSSQAFDEMTRLGITVLVNETVQLKRGANKISITGLDDIYYFYTQRALEALYANIDGFKIVAVHSPEIYDIAENNGYDLYLTGHTHGGQICLPGPIITHGVKRKYASGLWQHGSLKGYTSRGAGVSTLPMRVNCPGEKS